MLGEHFARRGLIRQDSAVFEEDATVVLAADVLAIMWLCDRLDELAKRNEELEKRVDWLEASGDGWNK
jgi:ubiquinone biosynthesis protein UbiJ